MATHKDSQISDIKNKIRDSKQEESPFEFGSQMQLDTRLLEVLKQIKQEFPDSNLKIQSELASEDEVHYFVSHCEIQIDNSSILESSNLISHLATHFQYLIDLYDSKIDTDSEIPEVKHNRFLLKNLLDELLMILETIKQKIPMCDF